MSERFQARPARSVDEVLAVCTAHEPATTSVISSLRRHRLGRGQRAWVVEGAAGTGGVAVVNRLCADRWTAQVVLADVGAAAEVARVVDRSRAMTVDGIRAHIEPIAAASSRARGRIQSQPMLTLDAYVENVGPRAVDRRTRVASVDDLDRLVELYAGYELTLIPTVPRLRRHLRSLVLEGVVVVLEERGRLLAASYASAVSDRYAVLSGLTVHPDHRNRGLGMALLPLGAVLAKQAGVGMAAVWAPTNAVRLKPARLARWTGGAEIVEWSQVWLGAPPRRFKGEGRIRAMVERVEGRVEGRPAEEVTNQLPGLVAVAEGDGRATAG